MPNEGLTATVGISSGDGEQYIISRYSDQPDLGGAASLLFAPSSGLPPGLVLTASGVLSGTPLQEGTFKATVRLTDSLGGFDERGLAIDVGGPCPADVDGSGAVGIGDLLALLAAWGPNSGHPADLDGDGAVGVVDLLALLAGWGPCAG